MAQIPTDERRFKAPKVTSTVSYVRPDGIAPQGKFGSPNAVGFNPAYTPTVQPRLENKGFTAAATTPPKNFWADPTGYGQPLYDNYLSKILPSKERLDNSSFSYFNLLDPRNTFEPKMIPGILGSLVPGGKAFNLAGEAIKESGYADTISQYGPLAALGVTAAKMFGNRNDPIAMARDLMPLFKSVVTGKVVGGLNDMTGWNWNAAVPAIYPKANLGFVNPQYASPANAGSYSQWLTDPRITQNSPKLLPDFMGKNEEGDFPDMDEETYAEDYPDVHALPKGHKKDPYGNITYEQYAAWLDEQKPKLDIPKEIKNRDDWTEIDPKSIPPWEFLKNSPEREFADQVFLADFWKTVRENPTLDPYKIWEIMSDDKNGVLTGKPTIPNNLPTEWDEALDGIDKMDADQLEKWMNMVENGIGDDRDDDVPWFSPDTDESINPLKPIWDSFTIEQKTSYNNDPEEFYEELEDNHPGITDAMREDFDNDDLQDVLDQYRNDPDYDPNGSDADDDGPIGDKFAETPPDAPDPSSETGFFWDALTDEQKRRFTDVLGQFRDSILGGGQTPPTPPLPPGFGSGLRPPEPEDPGYLKAIHDNISDYWSQGWDFTKTPANVAPSYETYPLFNPNYMQFDPQGLVNYDPTSGEVMGDKRLNISYAANLSVDDQIELRKVAFFDEDPRLLSPRILDAAKKSFGFDPDANDPFARNTPIMKWIDDRPQSQSLPSISQYGNFIGYDSSQDEMEWEGNILQFEKDFKKAWLQTAGQFSNKGMGGESGYDVNPPWSDHRYRPDMYP